MSILRAQMSARLTPAFKVKWINPHVMSFWDFNARTYGLALCDSGHILASFHGKACPLTLQDLLGDLGKEYYSPPQPLVIATPPGSLCKVLLPTRSSLPHRTQLPFTVSSLFPVGSPRKGTWNVLPQTRHQGISSKWMQCSPREKLCWINFSTAAL